MPAAQRVSVKFAVWEVMLADASLAKAAGAKLWDDGSVVLDDRTFETTVPGLFVVGSAGFGPRTGEVFIENGRLHARAAVATIASRLAAR